MSWGGLHPLVQVVLGVGAGYAIGRYLGWRAAGSPEPRMLLENSDRYETSSERTKRSTATDRCVARVDGECKFPVGDQYHQRLAIAYVEAGRCSDAERPTCKQVVDWVAEHGSGEAKKVARNEMEEILRSSRRAKARRSRTREKEES